MARAWCYGDNVDTDIIIPARYLMTSDPAILGAHALEGLDPDFASVVTEGDVVIAGRNFGSGSSREHAPLALKGAGVGAVVAASFARIFFRNAINTGLAILTSPEAAAGTRTGDAIEVDVAAGRIYNVTRDQTYDVEPLPEFVMEIVGAGGLVGWVRQRVGAP